jgi:hypothetical protein
MKQMMFTKEVDKTMVGVTNEIEDGEGNEDAETSNPPETPTDV